MTAVLDTEAVDRFRGNISLARPPITVDDQLRAAFDLENVMTNLARVSREPLSEPEDDFAAAWPRPLPSVPLSSRKSVSPASSEWKAIYAKTGALI